jgi:hypothetical protein
LLDAVGKPVPYLLRKVQTVRARTARIIWPARQLSAKPLDNGGLEIAVKLDDTDPRPQGLSLISPLRNFEHRVRVDTSTDGQQWKSAGEAKTIFDYSRYVDVRNDGVSLPEAADRHFRIVIDNVTIEQQSELLALTRRLRGAQETERLEQVTIDRRPFRIDRVDFWRDVENDQTTGDKKANYPVITSRVERDKKKQESIVYVDTSRQPLTSLELKTPDRNFSRHASVEVERLQGGKAIWEKIGEATLIGAIPSEHPLSLRWLGMHGAAFANWAVNGEYEKRANFDAPMVKIKDGADLLLAFGVRFDDRVTGKFEEFCKHGTIVHVDIDASELNKNRKAHLPVVGDIKERQQARTIYEQHWGREISIQSAYTPKMMTKRKQTLPPGFVEKDNQVIVERLKEMFQLEWRQDWVALGEHFVEIQSWARPERKLILKLITPRINQWKRRKLITIASNSHMWSESIRGYLPRSGASTFSILYEIAVLRPHEIDRGIHEEYIRPDCRLKEILHFKESIGRRSK